MITVLKPLTQLNDDIMLTLGKVSWGHVVYSLYGNGPYNSE